MWRCRPRPCRSRSRSPQRRARHLVRGAPGCAGSSSRTAGRTREGSLLREYRRPLLPRRVQETRRAPARPSAIDRLPWTREGASRCWIETLSDDYELTGGHAPRIAGGPEAVKQGGPRVLNGETHPTRPIPANARSALCPQTSPPHLPQSSRKFSAWFPITSLTTHRRNPEPQSPLESFRTIHSIT